VYEREDGRCAGEGAAHTQRMRRVKDVSQEQDKMITPKVESRTRPTSGVARLVRNVKSESRARHRATETGVADVAKGKTMLSLLSLCFRAPATQPLAAALADKSSCVPSFALIIITALCRRRLP
jgi:hypothetical protein